MEKLGKVFGSGARLKVIRLFVFNKDLAYSQNEIADRTKLSRSAVRRAVTELVAGGFLRKRANKKSVRYDVNPRFEYLGPLETFIRETTNIHPEHIVSTLRRAGSMRLVVLSGLFTGILEPKVDLLIVGDSINERALSHAVHALEAELGREIRYAFFPTADFRYRLGVYDRLLRDVFDYPHRLLLDKIGL